MIYSRVVMGIAVLALAVLRPAGYAPAMVALMALGLVSDIADGIVARRLGISTERLRRLDSSVDQVFWMMVIAGVIYTALPFFIAYKVPLALLALLEALTYVVSYVRFGREVATHTIGAKVWTLVMFAFLVQLTLTGGGIWLLWACVATGVASRMEILLILLVLRQWTNDVPSLRHALQLRSGKAISRNKWFNG